MQAGSGTNTRIGAGRTSSSGHQSNQRLVTLRVTEVPTGQWKYELGVSCLCFGSATAALDDLDKVKMQIREFQ